MKYTIDFPKNTIIVGSWDGIRCIFKYTGNLTDNTIGIDTVDTFFKSMSFCTGSGISFREASKEEKNYLKRLAKNNGIKLFELNYEIYY